MAKPKTSYIYKIFVKYNNQLKWTTLVYYVNNLFSHKLTILIFAPEF